MTAGWGRRPPPGGAGGGGVAAGGGRRGAPPHPGGGGRQTDGLDERLALRGAVPLELVAVRRERQEQLRPPLRGQSPPQRSLEHREVVALALCDEAEFLVGPGGVRIGRRFRGPATAREVLRPCPRWRLPRIRFYPPARRVQRRVEPIDLGRESRELRRDGVAARALPCFIRLARRPRPEPSRHEPGDAGDHGCEENGCLRGHGHQATPACKSAEPGTVCRDARRGPPSASSGGGDTTGTCVTGLRWRQRTANRDSDGVPATRSPKESTA